MPGGCRVRRTDELSVKHGLLLIAPPVEVTNEYLPVRGSVARLGRVPGAAVRLGGGQHRGGVDDGGRQETRLGHRAGDR